MRWLLAVSLLALSVVITPARAASDAEIEASVRRILVEKPEIIVEALDAYQKKLEEKARSASADIAKAIAADKTVPSAGATAGNARVTIVEFYDYNCGYCHKMAPAINDIVQAHKDVRWLFVDLPVLSPVSREVARLALAANNQNAYYKLHMALMNHRGGSITPAVALAKAREMGLNVEKLRRDSESPAISAMLDKHREWAKSLAVTGTPTFIIGNTLVPGAVDKAELLEMIGKEKGAGK